MKILNNIQENYRHSNKLLLVLRVLLNVFATYFAIRVIYISVSGLVSSNESYEFPGILLFGMLFSLGLSNAVLVFEKYVTGKKEHLKLMFVTTVFVLAVSVFVLLV